MKKVFALLLSVAMVICMMPSMAFAADLSTGTVTIEGTAKYNETLTANISELGNEGTVSYQWKRDGADISGATNATYQTIEDDIGKAITVVVTGNGTDENSATSDSVTIAKADQAAPTKLKGVAPSSVGGSDGKITGTTTDMEYSTDATFKSPTGTTCGATETTGLAAGTYYVRLKETTTKSAGANATVEVPAGGTSTDKDNLTAADFTLTDAVEGTVTKTYTGEAQEVTVAATGDAVGKVGVITVKYLDTADENATASEEAPTDAGTYTVTFDVAASDDYNEAKGLAAGTLVIKPAEITITAASATDRDYDKSKDVEVSVTFSGLVNDETLTEGTGYTVTGVMADANASDTPKDVTVTVTLKNSNYTFVADGKNVDTATCETTVIISKAAALTIADTNVKVKATTGTAQGNLTADLSSALKNVPEDATYVVGKVTEDDNSIIDIDREPTFDKKTKTLTYSLTAGAADTYTATIPVVITMTNYADSTAEVVVTMTAKNVPTVTANDIEVTYSGKAVDVVAESGVKATAADGSEIKPADGSYWALKAGTNPTNVGESGTFTLVFTPTGEHATYESVEKNISVTINKATPTGEPAYTKITAANKTLADAALAIGTLTPDDAGYTLKWVANDGTPLANDTVVASNTAYKWLFTPNDSANYNTLSGEITLYSVASIGGGGAIVTDPLPAAKTESTNAVQNYVKPADYEEAEAAEIKAIMDKAAEDIKNAKTEEEVKAIEAAAKEAIDKIDTAEEKAVIRTVEATKFRATSKRTTLHGKKAIKITWNKPEGVDFDGYDIYRSTKQFSGFGKKPFFTTTKQTYTNNKGLEAGKTYYYKVRAFKYVNGRKVYSEYSYKAIRTMK